MAKLHFYYSAMNAGKSTMLLQSAHNYREHGMIPVLLTPRIDNRSAADRITSRIGLEAVAIPFEEHSLIPELIPDGTDCVLIDEAQFLTKAQVQQLSDMVTNENIPVLAYGLRTDFQGEPFEGSQYLLAWAEVLTELKTVCHCGAKATMNMRIDEYGQKVTEGAQIEIGGNDRYVATCRKHFNEGKGKK